MPCLKGGVKHGFYKPTATCVGQKLPGTNGAGVRATHAPKKAAQNVMQWDERSREGVGGAAVVAKAVLAVGKAIGRRVGPFERTEAGGTERPKVLQNLEKKFLSKRVMRPIKLIRGMCCARGFWGIRGFRREPLKGINGPQQ